MKKIGIDVGGVIIEKNNDAKDTSFDMNDVVFVEGALETIARLAQTYDLYIVSYCGKTREQKTRKALNIANIAISEDKWYFTRSREAKGPVCEKLQLDYFIDDTWQVVDIVSKICKSKTFWFRGKDIRKYNITSVQSWTEIAKHL